MSETPTPSTAPSIEDARKMGAEGGPTVEAERLAFEAWMEGHFWSLDSVVWDGKWHRSHLETGDAIDPWGLAVRQMWAAWRDRAALSADALTADRDARERAEANLLCPGQMRCAKCKFELTRRTLFVQSGTVGAGSSETEPCPNGCGPLWPVTWEQEARACYAAMDRLFDEKQRAEAERDALAEALRRAHTLFEEALPKFNW